MHTSSCSWYFLLTSQMAFIFIFILLLEESTNFNSMYPGDAYSYSQDAAALIETQKKTQNNALLVLGCKDIEYMEGNQKIHHQQRKNLTWLFLLSCFYQYALLLPLPSYLLKCFTLLQLDHSPILIAEKREVNYVKIFVETYNEAIQKRYKK